MFWTRPICTQQIFTFMQYAANENLIYFIYVYGRALRNKNNNIIKHHKQVPILIE